MNIASIQFPVFAPYESSTVEIYVSGCKGKCDECHNPELWDYGYGEQLSKKHTDYLKERKDLFENISILGGDLLDQDQHDAIHLIEFLTVNFDKKLWLFTGYNKDEVFLYFDWVFEIFDYIKVGRYKPELKTDGFPASSNQRLLTKGKDY